MTKNKSVNINNNICGGSTVKVNNAIKVKEIMIYKLFLVMFLDSKIIQVPMYNAQK